MTGCYITLPEGSETLTLRIWTNLDSEANDESFGIDNVLVQKAQQLPFSGETHNTFDNQNNFEGWNCGSITTCGEFGQFCGGYNIKGSGSDLRKTFNLPTGNYSVQLDFIKIDSWFVRLIR